MSQRRFRGTTNTAHEPNYCPAYEDQFFTSLQESGKWTNQSPDLFYTAKQHIDWCTDKSRGRGVESTQDMWRFLFHVAKQTRWNEWHGQKPSHQICSFYTKTCAGSKKFRWFFVVSCCTSINQVQATVSEQIVLGVASFSAIMGVHDPRKNLSLCPTCSGSQCCLLKKNQSEFIWFHRQVITRGRSSKLQLLYCVTRRCVCKETHNTSRCPRFIPDPHSSQRVVVSNIFPFMWTCLIDADNSGHLLIISQKRRTNTAPSVYKLPNFVQLFSDFSDFLTHFLKKMQEGEII